MFFFIQMELTFMALIAKSQKIHKKFQYSIIIIYSEEQLTLIYIHDGFHNLNINARSRMNKLHGRIYSLMSDVKSNFYY